MATWRHLYSMADVRPRDLKKALTPEVKKQVLDAAYTAMEADLPDHAEDCILRAATFTSQNVDELTVPLAHPLRSIVRRLLQRNPEDRHPTAAALEAELREGLASLAAPYGATEALEEVYVSLMGARMNRCFVGSTNEEQLPPVMAAEADIITEQGRTQ